MLQVCRMASDYSRTCVSPDSIQTGEAPVVSETCEVYVWGSNSSHQLVEGTQEKILQPKLAASFADAQTVRRRRGRKRRRGRGGEKSSEFIMAIMNRLVSEFICRISGSINITALNPEKVPAKSLADGCHGNTPQEPSTQTTLSAL